MLTTGENFRIAFGALNPLDRERARGVVAFDRSGGAPLPADVFALFSLNVTRIAR